MERNDNNLNSILLDLSRASRTGLELIFFRLPSVYLAKTCRSVSKQWNVILYDHSFWVQKMRFDNYTFSPDFIRRLESIQGFDLAKVAVKKPFIRNFVSDNWNVYTKKFTPDVRWRWGVGGRLDRPPQMLVAVADSSDQWLYHERSFVVESPPYFIDSAWEIDGKRDFINYCLSTGYLKSEKIIQIRLFDEGLSDEILEKIHPPICISEWFAFRSDCAAYYAMECRLAESLSDFEQGLPFELQSCIYGQENELIDEQPECFSYFKKVKQFEKQIWRQVYIEFRNYRPSVRYLQIRCFGSDLQMWRGRYGSKMINCSAMALCE